MFPAFNTSWEHQKTVGNVSQKWVYKTLFLTVNTALSRLVAKNAIPSPAVQALVVAV